MTAIQVHFYDAATPDRDLILRERGVGGHIHPPEPEILLQKFAVGVAHAAHPGDASRVHLEGQIESGAAALI